MPARALVSEAARKSQIASRGAAEKADAVQYRRRADGAHAAKANAGEATEILDSDAEQAISRSGRAGDIRSMSDGAVSSISEDEYLELYRAAREGAGVKLPVYAEDGPTVIGEFIVDVL